MILISLSSKDPDFLELSRHDRDAFAEVARADLEKRLEDSVGITWGAEAILQVLPTPTKEEWKEMEELCYMVLSSLRHERRWEFADCGSSSDAIH